VQRYVYKYFVNDKIKATLCEDAFAVAIDILLRYMGPESEGDYIENGKYYDLEKGNTVVECGAYIGYYAMRAAEIVGKSGRVVAIEPIGENLRLLSMNVERNFLHNVTIVPKAVWKEKCVQIIFREAKQRASLKEIVKPGENIRVECDTIDSILDSFHLNQIDFIRIQINGTEIEALKGMTETLRKGPKLLIAAPYRRGGKYSYEEVISILSRNGYSAVRRGGNIFAWNG
jgi:FkbM family methyltransferase